MENPAIRDLCLVWVVACSSASSGAGSPPASRARQPAQQVPTEVAEAQAALRRTPEPTGVGPAPDPSLLGSRALAECLPEEVQGFIAEGPAVPHTQSNPAQGIQLPSATRVYKRDDSLLRIHVVDASHAPAMRESIKQTMGLYRHSEASTVMGRSVQGVPANIQWLGRTARTGLLLDDRVLVSISVAPAQDPEPALAGAERLDLGPLQARIAALSPTGTSRSSQ